MEVVVAYVPAVCLERLREATKTSVKTVGRPRAGTGSLDLTNTWQEYHYTETFGNTISCNDNV